MVTKVGNCRSPGVMTIVVVIPVILVGWQKPVTAEIVFTSIGAILLRMHSSTRCVE